MENGFEVQVNEAAPMENIITVKVQTQQAMSIQTHIYSHAMQMSLFGDKKGEDALDCGLYEGMKSSKITYWIGVESQSAGRGPSASPCR